MARARRSAQPAEPAMEATSRDFVMARLAASMASAQCAITAMQEATLTFMDPDDDSSGKERREAVAVALEQLGCATRALESAEQEMPHVDMAEVEPWDDDAD